MSSNNSLTSHPLVSVVTPVYNGEKYLEACIQSVLHQTYQNWEYAIVNNRSTDNSLNIAQKYAGQDARIRILTNAEFLPAIANFNHAVRKISPASKYCKILHADDLMFEHCVEKMVALAESEPSVGIVGSYVLQGDTVVCNGLSYPQNVFPGPEIARRSLNIRTSPGRIYVFGSPSSLLIDSELIRNRDPLYNDRYHMCADQELCYYLLQKRDFGFIHEILTYSRVHHQSMTSSINQYNRETIEELMLMQEFGEIYFDRKDHQKRFAHALDRHYKFLTASIFRKKDNEFWEFQKKGLDKLNRRLNRFRLLVGAMEITINKITRRLFHPSLTWQKIHSGVPNKVEIREPNEK